MAESDAGTGAAPSSPPPSEDPIAALRASEAKYRMLTENIKGVVWTLDPETARFVYVSPSVERLRGFTPEEIMAESMDAALVPESRAYLRGLMLDRLAAFLAAEGRATGRPRSSSSPASSPTPSSRWSRGTRRPDARSCGASTSACR